MCSCVEGIKDLRYAALGKMLENYRKHSQDNSYFAGDPEYFWLYPEAAIREISSALAMPSSEIYGWLLLWSISSPGPGQKYNRICTGTACHLPGRGPGIGRHCPDIRVEDGMTRPEDLMFTLERLHASVLVGWLRL
jgi:hypothetical protein